MGSGPPGDGQQAITELKKAIDGAHEAMGTASAKLHELTHGGLGEYFRIWSNAPIVGPQIHVAVQNAEHGLQQIMKKVSEIIGDLESMLKPIEQLGNLVNEWVTGPTLAGNAVAKWQPLPGDFQGAVNGFKSQIDIALEPENWSGSAADDFKTRAQDFYSAINLGPAAAIKQVHDNLSGVETALGNTQVSLENHAAKLYLLMVKGTVDTLNAGFQKIDPAKLGEDAGAGALETGPAAPAGAAAGATLAFAQMISATVTEAVDSMVAAGDEIANMISDVGKNNNSVLNLIQTMDPPQASLLDGTGY